MLSTAKTRLSCRKFLVPPSTNSCKLFAKQTTRRRSRPSAPGADRTKEFNRSKRREQRSGVTKPPFPPVQNRMHPLFEKASGLTETIIAGAIEVNRDKGSGLIESIYEWCLTKEFELRGLTCVSQKLVMIEYKGFTREEPLRFDMLVEGCVVVEARP